MLMALICRPLKGLLALVEKGPWGDGGQIEAYWMGTCGCVPAPQSAGGLLVLRSFARLSGYTKFIAATSTSMPGPRGLTRAPCRSSTTRCFFHEQCMLNGKEGGGLCHPRSLLITYGLHDELPLERIVFRL